MARPRRPDGLDPHSREARRLRGKPIASIAIHTETAVRLKKLSTMLGMTQNDTLKFLLDNRPELTFEPGDLEEVVTPQEDPPRHGLALKSRKRTR